MKDCIFSWIPIDTNVNAKGFQLPTIENQKDLFVAIFAPDPSAPEVVEPPPQQQFGYHNNNKQKDPINLKIDDLSKDWIDIMSFSHNVAHSERTRKDKGKAHIGDLTMTKFTCNRSPSLNYMSLRGEIIPTVIHRVIQKVKDNELPIIEYEMHHCTIDNVSISGGSGGKPVETLSVAPKVIIIKNVKLNVETGEFTEYQACKWDILKSTGSKTLIKNNNNKDQGEASSSKDLDLKHLMIDLDSREPSMVKLINDLDLVAEYPLPESTDDKDPDEFYRVLTNKDPALFELINVPSGEPTIEIIKKSISERLNIPLDTIKNLYNYSNGILIDCPKILKISNSFIVQTTDGKLYGH